MIAQDTVAGVRVRALIVANPNNPLGTTYTAAQLQEMIDFADKVRAAWVSRIGHADPAC